MASISGGYSRASTSAAAVAEVGIGLGRPASIHELAQRAEIIWDPTKDFKFWLKFAERARHAGQNYDLSNDLENAFVEYAKAATLILDKIPTHKEYQTRLDATQRDTLIIVSLNELMTLMWPSLSINRRVKAFWTAWAC